MEQKPEYVVLSVGIIINKLNRDGLVSLQNHFKKLLKKYTSKKLIDLKELNTFLFVRAQIPKKVVGELEQRKAIEEEIQKVFKIYAEKENEAYVKSIRNNVEIKELTEIIVKLIDSSTTESKDALKERVFQKAAEISARVNFIVSEIINNSYCLIWDFAGEQANRIIFSDLAIEASKYGKKPSLRVSTLIENLTAMQFAKACMNQLSLMLSSVEFAIGDISNYFEQEKNKEYIIAELNTQLYKSLRVIFGLLSSSQQVLSDINKQLKRMEEIKAELREELELLDFPELQEYMDALDKEIYCEKLKLKIDAMQVKVKTTSKNLLKLINYSKDIKERINGDMAPLVNVFSYALSELQTLKFYTNKFRDLAFFQAIPPNVEKETLREIKTDENIILKAEALFKTYKLAGSTVYALRGVDIEIKKGEMIAVVGPSGSGKTTLLNLLAGLDTPERGAVFLFGKNIRYMSDSEISLLRRKYMGFIFQYYNLIPQLTVLENVMLPGIMVGKPIYKVKKDALALLKEVGLAHYQNKLPIKLSGGEMQRVTIARSVVNSPAILFADEPTGDLDSKTGKIVVNLIKNLAQQKNMAVLFVTHDLEMAKVCDRIVKLEDGRVVG